MNNHKRTYLTLPERIQLIKEIQKGVYIVKDKTGKIQKKINKKLFTNHCKIIDVLEKLADIKELGQGAYGKALRVCVPKKECESNKSIPDFALAYSIKEVDFQDIGTYNILIENPDRYENAEVRMLQFLSSFVFSSATPHINLPIMSFLCEPSASINTGTQYHEKLITKRYIVSELADYGDMNEFVAGKLEEWKNNVVVWKVIFFQILSTLAIIHRYYPNFLHNDLHPGNLLVRSTYQSHNNKQHNNFFEYKVDGTIYYIPDVGFQILLWDFDFSCISGIIDNDKLITMIDEEDANLVSHRNQYYDIHMCFGLMNRMWGDSMPSEISDWLTDYLLTDQIPSAERDERILESIEFTTPSQLLNNNFFDQFKNRSTNINNKEGVLLERFTGELDFNVEFDFGEKENRYTDPKNCKYQSYLFFDPKNVTFEEKIALRNRYKCELASDNKNHITKISIKQLYKMEDWIIKIMESDDVSQNISTKEKKSIIDTSIDFFKQFMLYHHVTSDFLYAILCVSTMYSSFHHILAYVSPFNNFKYWYSQSKLEYLKKGELEDVYKQFCGFIARHIEKN